MKTTLPAWCEKRRLEAYAKIAVLTSLRLGTGLLFFNNGLAKVQHLQQVAEYFDSLNVMAPSIMAPIVSGLELSGGLMLLVGLLPRLSSVVLIFLMMGAIGSAHRDEMGSLSDLIGLQEFLLAQTLATIAAFGAGPLSVDGQLGDVLRRRRERSKSIATSAP